MLRFLLLPRQLALHITAILLIAAMTVLALWQMGRARGDAPPAAAPVPIADIAPVGGAAAAGAYRRTVTAQGTYDMGGQLTVPGRRLDGRAGSWIVLPLRVDQTAAVPVVRGWLPEGAAVPEAPFGQVTVTGALLRSEESLPRPPRLGHGEVATVDVTTLSARWPYRMPEGFVLAAGEEPAPVVEPTRIPVENAAPRNTGAPFSNVGYALQWVAFALLVGYLWWRLLRDRWREDAPAMSMPEEAR